MNKKPLMLLSILPIVLIALYWGAYSDDIAATKTEPIKGLNLVAPPNPFGAAEMEPIKSVGAEWVSIVPYAFSRPNEPGVYWGHPRQWWGEKPSGVIESVEVAHKAGLKVMIKPHVWVVGEGWPGDFDLDSEEKWREWERDYTNYILTYAKIADSMKVAMLCLGTEFRIPARQRTDFWKGLIAKVRKNYSGELTYAANWDNYEQIEFWDALDFIGIDGYFPLSDEITPQFETLVQKWSPIEKKLELFSESWNRRILFTEYGYRSVDFSTAGHWQLEGKDRTINQKAQEVAYNAFYESVMDERWYAGGFLWKWHPHHASAGGEMCDRFTPQNKLAENVVRKWYTKI